MSRKLIRSCANCMNAFDCERIGKKCGNHMLLYEKRMSMGFSSEAWGKFEKEWDEARKSVKASLRRIGECRNV